MSIYEEKSYSRNLLQLGTFFQQPIRRKASLTLSEHPLQMPTELITILSGSLIREMPLPTPATSRFCFMSLRTGSS